MMINNLNCIYGMHNQLLLCIMMNGIFKGRKNKDKYLNGKKNVVTKCCKFYIRSRYEA